MTDARPVISIVAPAFDEEEVLPIFHRELLAALARLERNYIFEIVYVDDGSRDRTLSLMRCWAATDPRVRYVSLSRNFGHQAAFTAGLAHASGDAVVLMDCDLQHPPRLISILLKRMREGHDLVLTLRRGGRPGLLRSWASALFVRLLRLAGSSPMREDMTDFCLLSRRAVDALLRMRESHRYLRGMVQWLGFSAAEVTFEPPPRRAGRTCFTLSRLLSFSLEAFVSSSRLPLRSIFVVGFFFLLLGLGTLIAGMLLPASIHLLGGCILLALGIVGEYVGRTFEQVRGRPLYLLKESEEQVRVPQHAEAA